jgi:hypothetical protein
MGQLDLKELPREVSMKTNFTFYDIHTEFIKAISVLILFLSPVFLYSCSPSAPENLVQKTETYDQQEDQNILTFHKKKNGKDNYWKAVFKDGQLVGLFKNGNKITEDNLEDYKDMVNDKLEELCNDRYNKGESFSRFNFGAPDLIKNMPDLQWDSGDMNYNNPDSLVDNEQLYKAMDSLRSNMKKLRKMKFSIHFDTSAFNKTKHKLMKNLQNIEINPMDFECNMDKFNEGMKNFDDEMKHNRIFNEDFHFDMKDFTQNMDKITENMKNFKVNLKGVKEWMVKYKRFIKDMRRELFSDGLIKSENEQFNIKFNSKKLIINDKKVPDNLFDKYKGIYKKDFGKDIDDEYYFDNDVNDINLDFDDY